MNKGKRILLTGGTGFIGHALMVELLKQNYRIRVLVRRQVLIKDLPVEVWHGNLTIPDTLIGIEKNIDKVVHCAGILGKWGTSEEDIHQTNVQGSLNLLRRFRNTPLQRFIYLSAGGVTGPLPNGIIADENSPCQPATAYEKSKLAAEQQLLQYTKQYPVPLLIVRPTFTYGPGDRHKLPLFQAIKKRRFAFIGNGQSLISPIYIDDLLNGILLALQQGQTGATYIISGACPVSKQELVFSIADTLGVKRPDIYIPYTLAWYSATALETLMAPLSRQPFLTRSKVMMMGDNFAYTCAKAQTALGYRAKISLNQGIAQTIKAYQQQGLL